MFGVGWSTWKLDFYIGPPPENSWIVAGCSLPTGTTLVSTKTNLNDDSHYIATATSTDDSSSTTIVTVATYLNHCDSSKKTHVN